MMTNDNRVEFELDLEEDVIFQLAMEAHKRDITLNNMIEIILRELLEKYKIDGTLVNE